MLPKCRHVDHSINDLRALAGRSSLYLESELNVLLRGHVGEQAVVLKHHAEPSALRGIGRYVRSINHHGAAISSLESSKDAQGGCLTAPTGAKKAHEFAGSNREGEVSQRYRLPEGLVDASKIDRCHISQSRRW